MSDWREKIKSRKKKPGHQRLGFAEEETTFEERDRLERERQQKENIDTSSFIDTTSVTNKVHHEVNESKMEIKEDSDLLSKNTPEFKAEETYRKVTDNLQKNYRKPDNETYRKVTDNLQIEKVNTDKVTDKVTDVLQKSYRNVTDIAHLVGTQKIAFLYLSRLAKENGFSDDSGNRITPPINGGTFANDLLKKPFRQAKNVIYELTKKGFILNFEIKNGRCGYTKFLIPKHHYQSIQLSTDFSELTEKLQITYRKVTDKVTDKVTETGSSKLVSNINNNLLTTDQLSSNEIQNDLLDVGAIRVDDLFKFNITRKQIQDIKNQKLNFTTSTMQDFVDRFAIYVSDAKNIKGIKSVPAVFVKMAQMASKGDDPLADIETDTDRMLRERIERLKAVRDERMKQEKELLDLEFEEWVVCLKKEQIEQLVPSSSVMKAGSSTQKIMLKNYFIDNIWESKREIIFSSNTNQPEQQI